MTRNKSNGKGPHLNRRELIAAGASVGMVAALGCGGDGMSGGQPDAGPAINLGDPEISAELWQTMSAWGRAAADDSLGTRINIYNPTPVPHRVVLQLFTADGELVVKQTLYDAMTPEHSFHIEVGELLRESSVPLPFEGSIWVGATPESGVSFMGLQGISYDWYGPAYIASVHGMRDFGNSNHDTMWTDLVLPKLVVGDRFVSHFAVLNASGDGVSEALVARPQIIIRDDDGEEIANVTIDDLPPYCTRFIDVRDLLGGASFTTGTIQIREPAAGLVATGFVVDTDNGGFVNADHFFDRHFVVDTTGFTG